MNAADRALVLKLLGMVIGRARKQGISETEIRKVVDKELKAT